MVKRKKQTVSESPPWYVEDFKYIRRQLFWAIIIVISGIGVNLYNWLQWAEKADERLIRVEAFASKYDSLNTIRTIRDASRDSSLQLFIKQNNTIIELLNTKK